MTVLLAIHRLSATAALEAREACRALALDPVDWVHGVPAAPPLAVIGSLEHGERRIPADLVALLDAAPAARLVLCAQEPLVKPRVVLDHGRISVLAPPVDRAQLGAALRAALSPRAAAVDGPADHRFEALRRAHWIAWTRGRTGPAISLHEGRGVTLVAGAAPGSRAAIADAMTADRPDAEREAALAGLAGGFGVAHLTPDDSAWVIYWPFERCPLWLYSPDRLPARWNAARGIAAVGRMLRLPAFPRDQLVGAWTDTAGAPDRFVAVRRAMPDGGSETRAALDELVRTDEHLTGFVLEVR